MEQLSGNPEDFRYINDYPEIEKAFLDFARYIKTKVVGNNVEYTCRYDTERYKVRPGSLFPRPANPNIGTGSIRWDFPQLLEDEKEKFRFAVEPLVAGDQKFDIITGGDVNYE